MKKLLITGASSFIGSFLVEEALKNGYEVYAGIRKTSSRQFLRQNDIKIIELNLSSQKILESQLAEFSRENGDFDYIIHNAGITYAKKKEDFYNVNFLCTKNLANAAVETGMPLKKFILISSLAAYGPGKESFFRPISIYDNRHPASAYGKSKLMAENYLRSLRGFPYLVINSTAVYGPRDKDFLKLISLINKGIEPYIGRNKQMISLIYVKDMARAIISLLSSSYVNRSYILSDGSDYNKEDFGNISKKILHRKTIKLKLPLPPVHFIISAIDSIYKSFGTLPFINTEKLEEISSSNWLCDSNELWNDINDKAEYTLENGISETIEWYKENKWL